MTKTATIQVRVDAKLKRQASIVLEKIGISASQMVNALYAQVVLRKGIPFELNIPNKKTRNAIKELESGKGKRFSSFKDMVNDAGGKNA